MWYCVEFRTDLGWINLHQDSDYWPSSYTDLATARRHAEEFATRHGIDTRVRQGNWPFHVAHIIADIRVA